MTRHSLLVAYRNFLKYKSAFLINLIGLSSGMACVILIALWVMDELSVDKFHQKDPVLYQAMLNHEESGTLNTGPDTQGILAEALEEEVPEIALAVEDTDATWFGDNFSIATGNSRLKMRGKFSGKSYFELFSFDLLHGQANQVLQDKGSIVISEKVARALFKDPSQAVGKKLDWNLLHFSSSSIVSGVFRDVPNNSTEAFDFVLPFDIYKDLVGDGMHWGNYNAYTYVEVQAGTNLSILNQKLANFVKLKDENSNVNLFLRQYSDRYLHGTFENGEQAGGRIFYVDLFSIIAGFILLIACINFMNLSTARSSRRMKEVGVKKAIGAGRSQLIYQYMGESVLLASISLMVAIVAVYLVLPLFNEVTSKYLQFTFDLQTVLLLVGVTLVTGIISGSYPALYLSAFSPASILRGKLKTHFGELVARKGLVIFQFALSVLLIVSVLIVYKQVEYFQSKNLGYNKENVLLLAAEGKATSNMDTFLEALKNVPGVINAAATNHKIVEKGGFTTGVGWEGKDPEIEVRFANATVYHDVIETLNLEVLEGRSFSREFGAEEIKVMFNETAIEVMGLEDPVGKTVNVWGQDVQIIGVVKDFHMGSLHEEIGPVLFRFDPEFLRNILIKIQGGQELEVLARIEDFYEEFNPGYSLQYQFMDQEYNALYQSEERVASLSKYFAGIAILISCLGLFGLATFTAERRSKEIGIRKILGSGNYRIVMMLSKDFSKMVIISVVIALPVSYFLAREWLSNFAFSIDLKWWYFVSAGLAALIIAWLTVGIQTFKASQLNPVKYLRDE